VRLSLAQRAGPGRRQAPLDALGEQLAKLGAKGRERNGHVVHYGRFRRCARFRSWLRRGRCILSPRALFGPLRLEDPKQFGRIDSEVAIVGPLRRKQA